MIVADGIGGTSHLDRLGQAARWEVEAADERQWLLLSRIDSRHFRYFYRKYHLGILSYLSRRCGGRRDAAEDLAADTFATALVGLRLFRWRGKPFGSWLYTIARNAHGKQERRRRAHREEVDPALLARQADGRPDAEADLIERQERALLRACLARLARLDRDLIVMHYWLGLGLADIGGFFGMPEGTVKSRLKRARDRLRVMMDAAQAPAGAAAGPSRPDGRGGRLGLVRRR